MVSCKLLEINSIVDETIAASYSSEEAADGCGPMEK